jgi:hypothetical protein
VDADAGTVRLAASMYAHEETAGWVSGTLKMATALQAADAQIKAAGLADATGASVAATPHPVNGPRLERDEMLDVLEHGIAPAGAERSAWEGEELEWTTGMVQGFGVVVAVNGDENGLSVELPFQSRTSLITVTTRSPNPQLGNGVLLVLHLPMTIGERDGIRFAAALTRRELEMVTRSHLLGSWCWRDDGLHFVSFLPNLAHLGRGDLLNLVMSTGMRAKWVAETFYGDDWEANRNEGGRPLATPAILDLIGGAAGEEENR